LTAPHADTTPHVDTSISRTGRVIQTRSLIVMPNPSAQLPYHAVATSTLPAMATSSLLGYVDLVAHQPVACASLLASQSCLTTKIRGGCSLPLASKFTPYWATYELNHAAWSNCYSVSLVPTITRHSKTKLEKLLDPTAVEKLRMMPPPGLQN